MDRTLEGHLTPLSPELATAVRAVADPGGKGRLDRATRNLAPSSEEAVALVALAADPAVTWGGERDARASELLTLLWNEPEASLLDVAPTHYGALGPVSRMALLAAVAAVGTGEAARTFGALITTHGWPRRPYPRVFRELGRLIDHGELFVTLYRAALEDPSAEVELETGNLLLAALAKGTVAPSALATLDTRFADRLRTAIDRVRQGPRGGRTDDQAYGEARATAGFLADLAGWFVASGDVTEALRAALTLDETWVVAFAVCSLLRLGASVDDAAIQRVAACDETRVVVFEKLRALGLLARFPFEQASLEAFAASDMVEWLKFPTELGHAPASLERMGRFTVEPGWVVFVWRFPTPKGELVAGLSGAYEVDAPPGPVRGSSTFSRFEPWAKQSPREHALAILRATAPTQDR